MTLLDLVVGILCAHRLTQLVVWDGITEDIRHWLCSKGTFLAELLTCAQCAGVWCSVLTVGLLFAAHRWWYVGVFPYAFAIAGAVSIIEHATHWIGGYDGP